jgi:hypothetical protein
VTDKFPETAGFRNACWASGTLRNNRTDDFSRKQLAAESRSGVGNSVGKEMSAKDQRRPRIAGQSPELATP